MCACIADEIEDVFFWVVGELIEDVFYFSLALSLNEGQCFFPGYIDDFLFYVFPLVSYDLHFLLVQLDSDDELFVVELSDPDDF